MRAKYFCRGLLFLSFWSFHTQIVLCFLWLNGLSQFEKKKNWYEPGLKTVHSNFNSTKHRIWSLQFFVISSAWSNILCLKIEVAKIIRLWCHTKVMNFLFHLEILMLWRTFLTSDFSIYIYIDFAWSEPHCCWEAVPSKIAFIPLIQYLSCFRYFYSTYCALTFRSFILSNSTFLQEQGYCTKLFIFKKNIITPF